MQELGKSNATAIMSLYFHIFVDKQPPKALAMGDYLTLVRSEEELSFTQS